MASVNTNDLRVRNAKNLMDSFTKDESYVFIGKSTQWDSDITVPMVARQEAGDNSPPLPLNNDSDFYTIWDNMLSMKKVDINKVFYMLPKVTWTSGVVYDYYRPDYSSSNRSHSNATSLYESVFYVVNQERNVYVCLDNNKNSQSLVEPMSTGDLPFHTSDGYQWLRIYKVSAYNMMNYSTNNLMPVEDLNANYQEFGQVFTVIVNSQGNDYTTSPTGYTNQVPYYFCNIVGDGRGAVARVYIDSGKITKVRVERYGRGYTKAKLDFTPNRVYTSLIDLDNKQNGVNPLGDGTFISTVIIGPRGGWGCNPAPMVSPTPGVASMSTEDNLRNCRFQLAKQLGGTRVCVFSDLKYNDNDFIENTQFRQLGIIQDIVGHRRPDALNQLSSPETLSAVRAIKVLRPRGKSSDFYVGETITQSVEDINDPDVTHNAIGTVVGWTETEYYHIIRYIQDHNKHTDEDGNLYRFRGVLNIKGDTSGAETVPDDTFTGELDDLTFRTGFAEPEVIPYTGTLTYITNLPPVQRVNTQTERISLLISY